MELQSQKMVEGKSTQRFLIISYKKQASLFDIHEAILMIEDLEMSILEPRGQFSGAAGCSKPSTCS